MPFIAPPSARGFSVRRRRLLGSTAALGLGWGLMACGGSDDDVPARPEPAHLQAALAELPAMARALLQRTGVPGLALAVVHGGRTLLAEGLGERRLGTGAAVDADTVFQLASISKPLGATVVARQVGERRVAWDSPMRELLPGFELRDAEAAARLTLGDLYAHRSGLPAHAGDQLEELGFDQQRVLNRLRLLPLAPLGSRYAYTNFGLTAAAQGVARVAGSDWATLCERSLYAPLGMGRTSSRYADFVQRDNRASGHMQVDGAWRLAPPRNADAQSPAGGASSSARDMACWLALLLARGRWQDRVLVDADALDAAMSPQAPGGRYGYGFNTGRTDSGRRLIDHSGAFVLGAATCFMLLPALDVGVVALSNGWPVGLPEALCRHFIDVVENGRATRDWWRVYHDGFAPLLAPGGSLLGQPAPTRPAPPLPLADYAGRYANDYFGALQVDVVVAAGGDQALQLTLGALPQIHRLRHWQGDDFVFSPASEGAPPGSVSLARFDAAGGSVWLEFYDGEGWGRFDA